MSQQHGRRLSIIRIVVADDHPVVRDGLVAILGTQPDFAVVGEASSGEETVRLGRVGRSVEDGTQGEGQEIALRTWRERAEAWLRAQTGDFGVEELRGDGLVGGIR